MDVLLRKQFHVHMENLTARQINLPEFMIVHSSSNALSCIIHEKNDEHPMLKDGDPTVNAMLEIKYKSYQ